MLDEPLLMEHTTVLSQWLAYIERMHPQSIDLGLSRILPIAQRLKCTNFQCPVIVVAGTNGKGSCVRSLEAIYLAAGYRVGSYTSPHLHQFNERVNINGRAVDDELLIAAFSRVEQARQSQSLSFFEFTTLAALLLFKQSILDVLILEIGLGGRLDAVNIVDADVSLITSIDLDHCQFLGDSRDAIGLEKAGICRSGRPVVCGDPYPPQSMLDYISKLNAPLYQINNEFRLQHHAHSWEWGSQQQQITDLPALNLKRQNIASSLMVIELLDSVLPVGVAAVRQGLSQVTLSGRFECWSKPIPCIFDVAHNPQAGHWLAEQLAAMPRPSKRIAIVGMLADKAVEATLAPLLPLVDQWYAADLTVARGGQAETISQALRAHQVKSCYNFASVADALKAAMGMSIETAAQIQLLVFGSFHTVAEVQRCLLADQVEL